MRRVLARLAQMARLMVGMPDYDAYCRHMAAHHPERAPMSRAAFFRDRQQARYGSGGGRCC
ncbi:YbdD/YjiX family protein [Sphingomonas abaci]|nr:YbdD/YjiX family protein [Sphingomonas abaci]